MPAQDNFEPFGVAMHSPIENAASVTPHDTNELSYVTRGLYVGVSGNVTVVLSSGDEVQLVGLAAGVVHPLRVRQVKATGTAATNIVALW